MLDICQKLPERDLELLKLLKNKSDGWHEFSPRFNFFTIHGRVHTDNIFENLAILINGGIKIDNRDLFLLCAAICIHDVGMLTALNYFTLDELKKDSSDLDDPSKLENAIRIKHHNLIKSFLQQKSSFLAEIGFDLDTIQKIISIGEAHRSIKLSKLPEKIKYLGALLRLADEMDIGPSRAPISAFNSLYEDMEPLSKWNWYKHIITKQWELGNTYDYANLNGTNYIYLKPAVLPAKEESISHWLLQVCRPIEKALNDEQCREIIRRKYNVEIECKRDPNLSSVNPFYLNYLKIENDILSRGSKPIILSVDDEVDKLRDTFYFFQDRYYVHIVPHPSSALKYLRAAPVTLLIVDIQISWDATWGDDPDLDEHQAGVFFIKKVKEEFPDLKICVLTGTRHPLPQILHGLVDEIIRKPIDPIELLQTINAIIE